MEDSRNKRISELVTLLARAAAIAESLQEAVPQQLPAVSAGITKMVSEKMANRECLVCGQIADKADQYRRGLDQRHYQKAQRQFTGKPEIEAEMMANGHLGPRGSGGRPAEETVLDRYSAKRSTDATEPDNDDVPPAHAPRGNMDPATKRKKPKAPKE